MSFMTCCVQDCFVRFGDGGILHRFPNPQTEQERFQAWISKIGGEVAQLDANYVHKNKRICHKHFEHIYYGFKNRLVKTAIPTLDLPDVTLDLPIAQELQTQSLSSASNIVLSVEAMPSTSNVYIGPITAVQPQQLGKRKTLTYQEIQLKSSIARLKKEVHRNKVARKTYRQRLHLAYKTIKHEAMKNINQKLTKAAKTFVDMQLKQAGKKAKGRRFTLQEKILALALYKPSPKAYRLLSNMCILPQRKTLSQLLQKIPLKPGINDVLFDDLKKKVENMPMHHKFCTIIFDEMSIAPYIMYNQRNDEIIGFTDNGVNKTTEFCDHALVFMVRGVIKKYKQPISFIFCNSSMKSSDLAKEIQSIITKVQDSGLKVVSTVCDQAAKNLAAVNILENKTKAEYLRTGREWKGGFFDLNGTKVVPIYDPPHLMKGIRNNLLTKDLKYNLKGKNCIAKWQHIIDLYKRGPAYNGVRLVPKLTAQHVFPNLIPKMRVKNCTQVFSWSVGVALGFMADAGKLPEASKETADILLLFDNIFDSVNGSSSKIEGGKFYRAAVTPTSQHHKLWRDALPIIKTMKYVDANGKTSTVPSITSWVKTIEGFKIILKKFNQFGLNSILLRNFNQDPIENFFGAIRSHGCQNIMPHAAAFQASYKTLMINNMTSTHSIGANCEKDENFCLLNSLENLFNSSSGNKDIDQGILCEEHLNIETINIDDLLKSDNHVDKERSAALAYCSGWLITKARKIYHNCATCKNNLESDKAEDYHNFIKISEYSDKQWLCYPTKKRLDLFLQIENITLLILKKNSNIKNLMQYISLICSLHLDLSFIICHLHKENICKFLIKKGVIFHIFTWCKNINKILMGKEINYDPNDDIQMSAIQYKEKNQRNKRLRRSGREVRM